VSLSVGRRSLKGVYMNMIFVSDATAASDTA
jgi:hypothetical protein